MRDDYDISSLDALTEDDVIEVVEWQDAADGEAVNTITVRWVDRDGAAQATTYTNRASVQHMGDQALGATRAFVASNWDNDKSGDIAYSDIALGFELTVIAACVTYFSADSSRYSWNCC